mmetsp:Transcript_13703/g.20198  ORF Transcript_13703/g.20198 Transcript_13703/m.20198 type:complete len:342 (-) Transcript_13703:104-1129(-)|eukprot:CAMPEP_0194226746 /NCGR_PEP_ID=MMETSP0156-20130528/42482_1 /TAXON_ID=33649 /ORGANISM="Thalassionema nitzschioides, Strain L26-B" /LENGTH=341 /DNA_ID=CAMNT_0038959203 /DNA_START=237 /DNA_END=1262 /DNA_ORIENTATION=-
MVIRSGASPLIPAITAAAIVTVTSYYLWKRVKSSVTGVVTVAELNVYPVKSCSELTLDTATPTPRGFEGDRIAQIIDKNGKYCTPRDKDKTKLFHVQVEIWGDALLFKSRHVADGEPFELDVKKTKTTPKSAEVLMVPDNITLQDYGDEVAAWFEKATGIPGCRLTGIGSDFDRSSQVNADQGEAIPSDDGRAPVSLADEAPYLLTNLSSLADLNKRLKANGKAPVDMRRFRPNIVIRGLKPWEEDTLKRIRINHVEFWVWQRCGRCGMTTIDRDTLERGPEPLATLSTFRERAKGMRNFGMHLIPVEDGIADGATITVDDEVEILEYDEERRKEWLQLFG